MVVARLYDHKVRPRQVGLGDLVVRRAEISAPNRTQGKLAPLEGSLPSHQDRPRGDLCSRNYGCQTVVEDMTHIQP
ncbi:hypothetical protein BHE74_00033455 [Ensete ventricosum]|nr:hypothetical protein BHE74_00033455 [Ensete ventricosum]RZS15094.1 hypothetical protein BHM03_00046884 [Ensete ventricosum]